MASERTGRGRRHRVVWFRRDLRLTDNPPLDSALAALDPGDRLVPLFVIDPRLVGAARMSAARLAYLADALRDLDASLRTAGGRLIVHHGDPRERLPAIAAEVGAAAVHWTDDVSPFAQRRDDAVETTLAAAGVAAVRHDGLFVHPPGSITTGAAQPYKVFTPFARRWRERDPGRPFDAPASVTTHGNLPTDGVPSRAELLRALPNHSDPSSVQLDAVPIGGERAAAARLADFLGSGAEVYHQARDQLAQAGTSRLSADLHYGCLSPRAVLRSLDRRNPGHDAFATELAWRDFYGHVLAAWPHAAWTEFDERYQGLPWRRDADEFGAWRTGQTGYPIVDAGMRQLASIGWLHNRARMIVASFLCKDLLIDWRLGEAHFLRHLVDGDVASNNGGWQWAAGTGTDAQPYFRIFNPVRQGEHFDADGGYVRRWVPELGPVPDRYIHAPWTMPDAVQADCGVRIGSAYPEPLVDHASARRRALDWYARHRR